MEEPGWIKGMVALIFFVVVLIPVVIVLYSFAALVYFFAKILDYQRYKIYK